MVYFQTKNPNFWRALEWKMLVYFMTIWYILWQCGIIYGRLLLFLVIWYIFPILVCSDQEKSGNPAESDPIISENHTIERGCVRVTD
jgi:hypothetical protein